MCLLSKLKPNDRKEFKSGAAAFTCVSNSAVLGWGAQPRRSVCMLPEGCWLRAYRRMHNNPADNRTDHSAGGYAGGSDRLYLLQLAD